MRTPVLKIAALTALGLVAACGDANRNFYVEAGSSLNRGNFGTATANNLGVQTGDINYQISLAKRFAEEVPTTINFEFDSAILDEAARAVLRRQADWIKQFPEVRFRVYGHTDLVGSNAYNRRLGQRRANAAVAFLTSTGIDRRRLEAVVSYGETRPVIVTENRERKNRRTVTEVTGFMKRHPLILNGKYAEVLHREYVESATELPPGSPKGLAAIADAGGG